MAPRTAMLLVVAAAALLAAAAEQGDAGCAGVEEGARVTQPLLYTGPSQRVKRGAKGSPSRCFHGQHREDLYLFQHYLHGVGNGFFVELGALDGYSYSITYFFEIYMQWRGLLIEASPQNHAAFRARSRALKPSRRRAVEYLQAAVCAEPRPLTYVSKEGTGAGIFEFMPPHDQARNLKMCKHMNASQSHNANAQAVVGAAASGSGDGAAGGPLTAPPLSGRHDCYLTPITCVNLAHVFRQRNVTAIDLFVLDVEGAELEVLRSVDLSTVQVRFFLIELTGTKSGKDAAVRCLLRKAGYEPRGRLDLNELWVKKGFPCPARPYTTVPAAAWGSCFTSADTAWLKPASCVGVEAAGGAAGDGDLGRAGADPEVEDPPTPKKATTVATSPTSSRVDGGSGAVAAAKPTFPAVEPEGPPLFDGASVGLLAALVFVLVVYGRRVLRRR